MLAFTVPTSLPTSRLAITNATTVTGICVSPRNASSTASSSLLNNTRRTFHGRSVSSRTWNVSYTSSYSPSTIQCANLVERFFRVVRSNVNALLNKAEDPEKMLEQAVNEMTDDLRKVREASVKVIADTRMMERKYEQAMKNTEEWYSRAQLALKAGNEDLAREALKRRKDFEAMASSLRTQVEQQKIVSNKLTQNMTVLESKLSEAKTKKDLYSARYQAAQTQQKVVEMLGSVSSSSGALEAFERMEEKVLQMEGKAEALQQISEDSLSKQFEALERGGGDDEDLKMLKQQMGLLPGSTKTPKTFAVDPEFERFKEEQRRKDMNQA